MERIYILDNRNRECSCSVYNLQHAYVQVTACLYQRITLNLNIRECSVSLQHINTPSQAIYQEDNSKYLFTREPRSAKRTSLERATYTYKMLGRCQQHKTPQCTTHTIQQETSKYNAVIVIIPIGQTCVYRAAR